MPYADLRELYANADTIAVYKQVRLPDSGRLILPRPLALNWAYQFGRVPSGNVSFLHEYGVASPSIYGIERGNRIEFWVGLRTPAGEQFSQIVFTGRVDSTSRNNGEVVLECVGMSKILEKPYRGELITLDGSITAEEAVTQLLDLAGAQNYYVDLPDWSPGECCPEPIVLKDMTIGDAINRIAMVDGSGWYEMPSGQIRVDRRDPIPADTSERTYYSMIPGPGYTETAPPVTLDYEGRPRIVSASSREFPQELRTRITIRGATCVEEVDGSSNNIDIEATASDPASPFVDECPGDSSEQGEDIPFETIDCEAKASETATRYLDLYNRLVIRGTVNVPLDPTLFTGLTCQVEDPAFSELTGNWFVEGYNCSLNEGEATSSIQIIGGPDAGTQTLLNPWADFQWKKLMEGDGEGNDTFFDEDAPPPPGEAADPETECAECEEMVDFQQHGPGGAAGIAVGWSDSTLGSEEIGSATVEISPGLFVTKYFGARDLNVNPSIPAGWETVATRGLSATAEVTFALIEHDSGGETSLTAGSGGKYLLLIPKPYETGLILIKSGNECGNIRPASSDVWAGFGSSSTVWEGVRGAVAGVAITLGSGCCQPFDDAKETIPNPDIPDPDPEDPADLLVQLKLDASQSRDWDGTIVSYAWSDDQTGAIGTGKYLTKTYPTSLTSVEITLTVTDNDGLTATMVKTVALAEVGVGVDLLLDGGDQSAPECLTLEDCVPATDIFDLLSSPTFTCGDD